MQKGKCPLIEMTAKEIMYNYLLDDVILGADVASTNVDEADILARAQNITEDDDS